jgi:threonine synthase
MNTVGMDGTSDDLDEVVKGLFEDQEFKSKYNVCSINSINVGRIIFQMVPVYIYMLLYALICRAQVHYFFAYFRAIEKIQHKEESPKVVFAVPTGAFGNGVAGILVVVHLMTCD